MVTTPTGKARKPAARKRPAGAGAQRTPARTPGARTGGQAAPNAVPARQKPGKSSPGGLKLRERWEAFMVLLEGSGSQATGSSYYMILGSTLGLTVIGLMMVLSASSVEAIANAAGSGANVANTFDLFVKQLGFAALGVFAMVLFSKFGPRFYRVMAWPALILAVFLLVLVLVIGEEVNGNKNWLTFGPVTGQPSEAAKLAMAMWLAMVLARKKGLIAKPIHALVPAVPGAGILIGLVLLGHDLGTVIIMGLIMLAALFFAGVRLKILFLLGAAAGVLAAVMSAFSGNRTSRISAWLQLDCSGGLCDQANAGMYALASGGWLGLGIGQSRQKWNWIPEAHNDFIFAIIGEEFGLLGTLVVLVLFGILAVATVRVTMRHTQPFIRIVCGCILVWIIGQAAVNIAMVTGLLPVIGVPLPFISYGGSSLTFTLAAVGVLLSFARTIPEREPAAT
ncbi:FtsW/RodA/SpoVE family cell cycle protein [Arthrobacter caoxuetaonis]|uniref:Probable peptidoglycan glycosyltransferase FtsW n=1 Tax=Arthrobacter caoxuetaonis TaxID=2886935 RepID=A0A9X1SCY9_9MICC|nr:putative peptidoglycan glycosyltransferase FtsW [Arthrobacter caoxuetaonis]MCC3299155.1 putative lipid II flippase FtsW [Arthrobacter caoxuetaonis]USQ58515.1 putative lipid II flippase FtsW [Arthrobacter caoxuetaonis]